MAAVYYPVVNVPRTRGFLASYVSGPAYQGSNGLGADAATTIAQQAAAAALAIAQAKYGTPQTQTIIQQIPYAVTAPPAPQKRWLPWVIGGGAVVLLGGITFAATRRRRK